MGKSKRNRNRPAGTAKPVTDKTLWFTDLTSVDPGQKNEVWAAQALFFIKRNSRLFLDPSKAKPYRDADNLIIDQQKAKELVDPRTPMGAGGTAEYFASDFKANPIYIHLKNIVKTDIENTGKQISVDMTDKFAKTRQMADNYKIIYQREMRTLINKMAAEIGIPGVRDSQDPYKWINNLVNGKENGGQEQTDVVSKFSDLIKSQITDNQDLALYNEFIYKGDYEIAFELGIKYYIFDLNKWHSRFADEFINDIMHFNKACGEQYTNLYTGMPVIERFIPEALYTSPFHKKDGDDIQYYFTEYNISFGEFMKTIGKNLKPEKLKEVFVLMKQQGFHSIDWRDTFWNFDAINFARDAARVRVGRAAFLSTDMEIEVETDSGFRRQVPLSWKPLEGEHVVEKRYEVWRWWYYIPPTLDTLNNANWQWQSNFIFELQKFQDQQRHGDNGRYSKPPLVIYDNSSQATYSDIVQAFMPKINHLWHRYQNYIVNDIDAQILSEDFIGGLLGAVDESNGISYGDQNNSSSGNAKMAYQEQWRMIKQNGTGFLKMTDKNGNPILEPGKMVIQIKNNYLEKAESCITQMLMLYDYMIKSLAFSPMTAGEEVKPRTPVAALEQTIQATARSRFFISKAYEDLLKGYGERTIRFIIDIAREVDLFKFPDRWEDFMQNVGYANGLAIEGMKDVDPECVGMSVNYLDPQAKKDLIMQLALEHVKTKELDESFIYLLMGVDNWKYAFVLMRMAIKQKKIELNQAKQEDFKMAMAQKEKDLQIAVALKKVDISGEDQNIVTQGKVDMMVNDALNRAKYQSQSQLKSETDRLRQGENRQKADLDKERDAAKINMEAQAPL